MAINPVESRQLFFLVAGVGFVSVVLPSLITQLNWMSPEGLLPLEERKKWLLRSWIIAFVVLALLYYYVVVRK